jgi:tetratricopeptide (TPR) repeat protein
LRFRLVLTLLTLLLSLVACTKDPSVRTRDFIELGNKYFEKEQYAEASIMYKKALQYDRLSAEAYYRLGITSIEQEKMQEAFQAFTRAFELDATNLDIFLRLADLHFQVLIQATGSNRELALTSLIHHTERAEAISPAAYEVLYVKGKLALGQAEYADAIALLDAAEKAKPRVARTAVASASAHFALGEVETARAIVEAGMEVNPEAVDFYSILYMIQIRNRELDQAAETLTQKCSVADDSVLCWLSLANHYRNLDQPELARKVVDRILENQDSYEKTLLAVADYLSRTGQVDRAVQICEVGIESEPEQAVAFRHLMIQAQFVNGEFAEANKRVSALLEENPEDAVALGYRGTIRMTERTREAFESGRDDLDLAVSLLPQNSSLRFYLGQAHLGLRDFREAKQQFEEAIRLNAGNREASLALVRVHLSQGEYTQAEILAENLIRKRPSDLQAHLSRAAAWTGLREYAKARAGLQAVERIAPNNSDVIGALGRLDLLEQKLPEAVRRFRAMVKAFPDDPRGTLGLVDSLLAQGKVTEAQSYLGAASLAWPENAGWRVALADLSVGQGDVERAEQEYRLVLETHPDSGVANLRIGELHLRRDETDKAKEHFNRAWAAKPPQPFAAYHLGTLHARAAEYAEARQWFEKALELAPDLAVAMNNLAFVLSEMNVELDQALTYAQRAVARVPDHPEFQDTLGTIYTKRELYTNAIEVLEPLVEKNPTRADFRYHLAIAFHRNENPERAKQELLLALKGPLPDAEARQARRLLDLLGG